MKRFVCVQNSKIEEPVIFLVIWERYKNHQNRIVVFNCETGKCITDYLITIESLLETEKYIKDNYYNWFNNQELLRKF